MMGTIFPAHADPSSKQTQNLQTWTSSDRFALAGCLVLGLGAGVGGTVSYLDSQTQFEKVDKLEMDIQKKTSKLCPAASGCDDVARMREDAERQERGAVIALVLGGLMIGLIPVVIYNGFQPKKPSAPNLMMQLAPVVSPAQGGLVLTGRF